MRALVHSQPGGPEVLQIRDVPAPVPSLGEVRVRVRAAGLNRADLLQRIGVYPAPHGAPKDIPGLEFSGEVDALGEGVRDFAIGDRVMGLVAGGAHAEHVTAHERTLARMPVNASFREAAAIPEAFLTAWDAMCDQAGLGAGDHVLVHAVGSGVGTAAVQIARAVGAIALGTARTADKIERAKALGLAVGILTTDGRFSREVLAATNGRGVDVVLDLVGGAYIAEDIECVAHRARIVVVGLLAGPRADVDLAKVLHKRTTLIGTVLRARPLEEKIAAGFALRKLVPLFEDGRLRPVVDRAFPLDRAADAHEELAKNTTFGKLVLEV
jgi:putative PIG3 family NAD(P)H quinone oxidoreductase